MCVCVWEGFDTNNFFKPKADKDEDDWTDIV